MISNCDLPNDLTSEISGKHEFNAVSFMLQLICSIHGSSVVWRGCENAAMAPIHASGKWTHCYTFGKWHVTATLTHTQATVENGFISTVIAVLLSTMQRTKWNSNGIKCKGRRVEEPSNNGIIYTYFYEEKRRRNIKKVEDFMSLHNKYLHNRIMRLAKTQNTNIQLVSYKLETTEENALFPRDVCTVQCAM